jgi:LuxR family transcriptional regulator, maltose regulon positive regulatory protein
VSLDEQDNDPKLLLSYVAEALDAVEPVGGRVFDALASADSSVPGSVAPRLGAALASMTGPVVLGARRRAPAAQHRGPGRAVGAA